MSRLTFKEFEKELIAENKLYNSLGQRLSRKWQKIFKKQKSARHKDVFDASVTNMDEKTH